MNAYCILTWDWRDQPPWPDISQAIGAMCSTTIYDVETGYEDQCGIVIMESGPYCAADAQTLYDRNYGGEIPSDGPDIDAVLEAPFASCPHCGGKVMYERPYSSGDPYVTCDACRIQAKFPGGWDKDAVRQAWNRRVQKEDTHERP